MAASNFQAPFHKILFWMRRFYDDSFPLTGAGELKKIKASVPEKRETGEIFFGSPSNLNRFLIPFFYDANIFWGEAWAIQLTA